METPRIFISSAYCDPHKHFPVNLTPYIPEDALFHSSKEPFIFKSKQELAREHIDYAIEQRISFSDFVFDHWYLSEENVRHIESKHRTFISELATNSLLLYRHKWVRADELVKLIPATDFTRVTLPNKDAQDREFFVHSFATRVRFLGKKKYLIVIARGSWTDDDSTNCHIYITNRLNIDGCEVLRRWGLRWGIERIHQELKECCALDQFQVREARDIARHCHLAMLAHSYLYWGLHRGLFAKETADKPKNIYEALEIHRGLHSERSLVWSAANPETLRRFLRLSRISKSNFDASRKHKIA